MSTTTMTTPASTSDSQVRIQLSTRDESLEFPEKPGPILVSTTLARYALSTLTNTLLSSTSPIPFEFLINGQFLRTSLSDFLTQNGISAESTLNIEYIRAQLPPSHQASFEHDDWVSSVDVLSATSPAAIWTNEHISSSKTRILSASYDGLLRIWDTSGNIIATSTPQRDHTSSTQKLLSTAWLTPTTLVAAGWSRALRLYSYTEASSSSIPASGTLTPTLDLYGHKLPVHSLAVHTPSNRILSASADNTALLWSSDPSSSSAPPPPSNLLPTSFSGAAKRRKLSAPEPKIPSRGPLTHLTGHTAAVRDVIFHPNDATVAYTVSSDRTFRTWDLETSACVSSRTPGPHVPLASVCALKTLGLVAAGTTSTRSVLLLDPREGGGSSGRSVVMTLRGHRNDVVALAADPTSEYGLASGSHDGTVRVWDVRNASADGSRGMDVLGEGKVGGATFRIPRRTNAKCDGVVGGEGVKVLGMCWDASVGVVSAGEDKMVQVDKSEG